MQKNRAVVSALSFGMALAAFAAAPRNLAFRRAVYQSSAADYTHVGHLATDGVRADADFRMAEATCAHRDTCPVGELPRMAIDGSPQSKWLIFKDTGWFDVALPQAAKATSYALVTANDDPLRDPKDWVLQGSVDGTTYVDLDRQTNVSIKGRHARKTWPIAQPGVYAHYRLVVLANNGDKGLDGKTPRLQFAEFDLLDADGKSVIRPAGSEKLQSQWVSRGATNEWLTVDLGAKSLIDKVRVAWGRGGAAKDYALTVSLDGTTWREVARRTDGKGGEETLACKSVAARYVKLACIRALKDHFAVAELEVWGQNDLAYCLPAQAPLGKAVREPLTGGNWKLAPARDVTATGEQLTAGAFDDAAWLPAVVPGTVLTSYQAAGAIPDMNIADNQLMISDGFFDDDFWYRNTFTAPARLKGVRTWLNFDAVNWKADVFLNGTRLGTIEGAFLRKRFDVTDLLRPGEANRLAVRVHKNATPGEVTVQDRNSPGKNGGVLGRDNPTIHASIGWDWVPTIRGRNIGLYRDVSLSYTRDVTLSDGWVITDLDVAKKDFSQATATVRVRAHNASGQPVKTTLKATIGAGDYRIESKPVTLAAGETREVEVGTVTMRKPDLWWPATYGRQPLYTAKIEAAVDGKVSDSQSFKFGVRKFTFSEGKPLEVHCNGTRIVCRGGNWGMDDANLAASPADYDTKVRLHAEANLTMIRNWVGMTNSDDFYKACDKYGVLVWDDFWLANPADGPDPSDPKMFLANARDKVLKNRHHASIPFYCGRNEGNPPASLFDALPKLVKELDGTRHYIPHSAAGTVSGFGPYAVRDPKWYFANAPKTLHSERGQPNVPELESMRKMLGPDHLWPIDDVWGLHDFTQGGAQGCGSFVKYIERSYGQPMGLEDFVRKAQMVAYENHKAMFESVYPKKGNGILMWMSQSAWPSMVWQTYDYWHDVNGGWAGSQAGNQPLNLIYDAAKNRLVIVNATAARVKNLVAHLEIHSLAGQRLHLEDRAFEMGPDEILDWQELPKTEGSGEMRLLVMSIVDGDGRAKARNVTWVNPVHPLDYRELAALPAVPVQAKLDVKSNGAGGVKGRVTLVNKGKVPAMLVRVGLADKAGAQVLPVHYSVNYVTLLPGEEQGIAVEATRCANADGLRAVVRGWNVKE